MLCRLTIAAIALIGACPVLAQQAVGFAYYDADHLYDTVPSPFYDDTDYTPDGRLGWNTDRYRRKVAHTAATIDSLSLPLVALWSVENEAVVRDLAAACRGGYSYLHRTLNSLDGMDFALLYFGDVFFPMRSEEGRRYLLVEGVLRRPTTGHGQPVRPYAVRPATVDTVGIVLCSDARMAEWVVRDLRDERPHLKLLVAGRIPPAVARKYGLHDPLFRAERAGRGNLRRRGGWHMRDRILVDTAFRAAAADVFMRRYLVDPKTGAPLATYERRHYRGGYGYALPVFAYIE